MQVMVVFVGAGEDFTTGPIVDCDVVEGDGVGVGVATDADASWVNFTLIVGFEKVKPLTAR